MALAKDSFFVIHSPWNKKLVHEIEALIDNELLATYEGDAQSIRIRPLEGPEYHQRVKVEVVCMYERAGWRFYWGSDSRDGTVFACLS